MGCKRDNGESEGFHKRDKVEDEVEDKVEDEEDREQRWNLHSLIVPLRATLQSRREWSIKEYKFHIFPQSLSRLWWWSRMNYHSHISISHNHYHDDDDDDGAGWSRMKLFFSFPCMYITRCRVRGFYHCVHSFVMLFVRPLVSEGVNPMMWNIEPPPNLLITRRVVL